VDVAAIVERLLGERLDDGGWNCEAENGSVRARAAAATLPASTPIGLPVTAVASDSP